MNLWIANKGGHTSELLELKKLFNPKDFFIFEQQNDYKLKNKIIIKQVNRNNLFFIFYFLNLFLFKAPFIIIKYKPKNIISTGTFLPTPFYFWGKIFYKTNNIYIETISRVTTKSLSLKINQKLCKYNLVQWKNLVDKKTIYKGRLK